MLLHGATPLHLACACIGTILPDDASDIVGLLASGENLSQSVGSAISGEPSMANNFGHNPSGNGYPLPDPVGPFRQLLPIQEASPLVVAAAAPGDAGAMIEALVANGADVKGDCGVRALMVCLIAGKRTRSRTLLHHEVRASTTCIVNCPPQALRARLHDHAQHPPHGSNCASRSPKRCIIYKVSRSMQRGC